MNGAYFSLVTVCGTICAVVLMKRDKMADVASFSSAWGDLRESLQGVGKPCIDRK